MVVVEAQVEAEGVEAEEVVVCEEVETEAVEIVEGEGVEVLVDAVARRRGATVRVARSPGHPRATQANGNTRNGMPHSGWGPLRWARMAFACYHSLSRVAHG